MKNRNLKKSVLTCELAFLAAGILNVSSVQAADEAGSLNELLQLIKSAKISESKENKAREAEFRRSKANQASLLKKAEATKDAEERKSIQLEKQYADNENQVAT